MSIIKVDGNEFLVSAKFIETVQGFPNDKQDKMWHNKFRVKVCRGETKNCKTFSFYGSFHDFQQNKYEMNTADLKNALSNFMDDAIYGGMSFEDFCSELGYDEDSISARRIWKATQKSRQQVEELGISEDELYEITNKLRD